MQEFSHEVEPDDERALAEFVSIDSRGVSEKGRVRDEGELGNTPAFFAKSAQTIEKRRDGFLICAKSAKERERVRSEAEREAR